MDRFQYKMFIIKRKACWFTYTISPSGSNNRLEDSEATFLGYGQLAGQRSFIVKPCSKV